MATKKTEAPVKSKKVVEKNGEVRKKEGLRKPQVRILACLAKSKTPMSSEQIAEEAPCDRATTNFYLGNVDLAVRKKYDEKYPERPCLLTLGYAVIDDVTERPVRYTITKKGREALTKSK